MGNRFCPGLFACIILIVFILSSPAYSLAEEDDLPELLYFWGEGCHVCAEAFDWLDLMEEKYPQLTVRRYEVFQDQEQQEYYQEKMTALDSNARWVPAFILSDTVWEGFNNNIARSIEAHIVDYVAHTDSADLHLGDYFEISNGSEDDAGMALIEIGVLGSINIDTAPLAWTTVLIALVDGFNPCSLWVLTILLAMVLSSRSRLRTASVGAVFLLVTAAVYGLFITGLFSSMKITPHTRLIQFAIAILALIFATFSIKDYFAYGKGFSLTISGKNKKMLIDRARRTVREGSLYITLALTAIFAVGAALVELPCTAGFPVVWIGIINESDLAARSFGLLLTLYLTVYLLVEIIIIITVLATMRLKRLQEEQGRSLKLISGSMIATIALFMLVDPTFLHGLRGVIFIVILTAIFVITLKLIRFLFTARKSV